MAFSEVKIHYYRFMFRCRCRRLLVFSALISTACMFSLAGTAQVVSSQIQDQVQEHFLAAQQAQQQDRLDDAAHEYLVVLKFAPGLPEAYVNLGLVYYAQSKFDDSARALSTAGKLRPGMRGVSLWLGIDEVRLNHPAQAVPLLREANRQDPQDKQAESWLGTALWNAGRMDAALLQLRKASAQFPDDPDLLFSLGEAYGKAARQQSEQLLEDSAGTAISDRIYASTYAADHDWTKAEGHLRRAIQRDPKSVDARLDLAEVFLDQAQLPAALEQLEQARTLSPHSATVLAIRGESLILSGQVPEGVSNVEQAIKSSQSEALDALGLPVEGRIATNERTSSGSGEEVSPTSSRSVPVRRRNWLCNQQVLQEMLHWLAYMHCREMKLPLPRPTRGSPLHSKSRNRMRVFSLRRWTRFINIAMTRPRQPFSAGWHVTLAIFPRALSWLSSVVKLPWRRLLDCSQSRLIPTMCTNCWGSFMSTARRMRRLSPNILPWPQPVRTSPMCTFGSVIFTGNMAMQTMLSRN